jgi:L-asparaginase
LKGKQLKYLNKLDNNVVVLKLFPGITKKGHRKLASNKGVKRGIVLETYGSGNSPSEPGL